MWSLIFATVSATLFAIGVVVATRICWYSADTTTCCYFTELIVMCISFGMSCLTFDIWRHEPGKSLSFVAIVVKYVEVKLTLLIGWWSFRMFKKDIRDIKSVQEQTLMNILKIRSRTKFGKDHDMKSIRNVEEFREKFPLSSYEDYKPYVDAIMNGETNVLFPEKVEFFGATSGTTSGTSKLFPLNFGVLKKKVLFPMTMTYSTIRKQIPAFGNLKPIANFRIGSTKQITDIGIPKGSVSTAMLPYRSYYSTPEAGYDITTEKEGMYVHALFALKDPEVSVLIFLGSSVLLSFLMLIKHQWRQFVRDIRHGKLDPELAISKDVRKRLEEHLVPDQKRADELLEIFDGNSFVNIIPRVWPHCDMVNAMSTGTFEMQANMVREQFGRTVPVLTTIHLATEGQFGVILYDGGILKDGIPRKDFVLIPRSAFFEFIPIEDVLEEKPRTVLAHQVTPGCDYELVVTHSCGLYRYRTQDVIRVVGFRQTVPLYNVRERTTDVLNIGLEKVPESVVTHAVVAASMTWKSGNLIHFSVTENIHCEKLTNNLSGEARYVFFIELETDTPITKDEKSEIDIKLCEISDTYRVYREKGSIKAPEVVQVPPGTFDVIKQTALNNNPLLYVHQFKWPRILRKPEFLSILIKNEIKL